MHMKLSELEHAYMILYRSSAKSILISDLP